MKRIMIILICFFALSSCVKKDITIFSYNLCEGNCITIRGRVLDKNYNGIKLSIVIEEEEYSFMNGKSMNFKGMIHSNLDGSFTSSIKPFKNKDAIRFFRLKNDSIGPQIEKVNFPNIESIYLQL
jgi:hypothetical protein